jgi:hypothetical protein
MRPGDWCNLRPFAFKWKKDLGRCVSWCFANPAAARPFGEAVGRGMIIGTRDFLLANRLAPSRSGVGAKKPILREPSEETISWKAPSCMVILFGERPIYFIRRCFRQAIRD